MLSALAKIYQPQAFLFIPGINSDEWNRKCVYVGNRKLLHNNYDPTFYTSIIFLSNDNIEY